MDRPLIEYVRDDIFELTEAAGHVHRVLTRVTALKGTAAHGVPQTLSTAWSEIVAVTNVLMDYEAELIQDGDAETGQSVDTYA